MELILAVHTATASYLDEQGLPLPYLPPLEQLNRARDLAGAGLLRSVAAAEDGERYVLSSEGVAAYNGALQAFASSMETDWHLWACDQVKGRDVWQRSGTESELRDLMQWSAARGRDVWLIAPDGTKHLPLPSTELLPEAPPPAPVVTATYVGAPANWSLWACDHTSGRDFHLYAGSEADMRSALRSMADAGRDVWLIAPDGRKHLPGDEVLVAAPAARPVVAADEPGMRC